MPGISPNIYNRLEKVLLNCGPFDNASELKAVFIDTRINAWHDKLPDAENSKSRVSVTIDFLYNKYNQNEENALVLFLRVLLDRTSLKDACRRELTELVNTLEGSTFKDEETSQIPQKKSTYLILFIAIILTILVIVIVEYIFKILISETKIIAEITPTTINLSTPESAFSKIHTSTPSIGRTLTISSPTTIVPGLPTEMPLPRTFTPPPFPLYTRGSGAILFHSLSSGQDSEIYAVSIDDNDQIPLTRNSADDMFVSWSPDGTRVAFNSNRVGNSEIYIMQADGTEITRLTVGEFNSWYPSWSVVHPKSWTG